MQTTEIKDGFMGTILTSEPEVNTEGEYDFLLAKQMAEKLLEAGLLCEKEFKNIVIKLERKFRPFMQV